MTAAQDFITISNIKAGQNAALSKEDVFLVGAIAGWTYGTKPPAKTLPPNELSLDDAQLIAEQGIRMFVPHSHPKKQIMKDTLVDALTTAYHYLSAQEFLEANRAATRRG